MKKKGKTNNRTYKQNERMNERTNDRQAGSKKDHAEVNTVAPS